jgi:hypothetical protein
MSEENKHLKDFLKSLNSQFNIWIVPIDDKDQELMEELKEIIGEENWEEYLKKQEEFNRLKREK